MGRGQNEPLRPTWTQKSPEIIGLKYNKNLSSSLDSDNSRSTTKKLKKAQNLYYNK